MAKALTKLKEIKDLLDSGVLKNASPAQVRWMSNATPEKVEALIAQLEAEGNPDVPPEFMQNVNRGWAALRQFKNPGGPGAKPNFLQGRTDFGSGLFMEEEDPGLEIDAPGYKSKLTGVMNPSNGPSTRNTGTGSVIPTGIALPPSSNTTTNTSSSATTKHSGLAKPGLTGLMTNVMDVRIVAPIPLPVHLVKSDIKFGGKGSGSGGDDDDDKEKTNNRRFMMALAQMTGMDAASAMMSGGDPVTIGINYAKNKYNSAVAGLGSDRIGSNVRGVGDAVGLVGAVSMDPFSMVIGGFLTTIGKSIDAIQDWNAALLKSHFQFAEFSAAMTNVVAQQEIREIWLSRDRGNRRAASAERQAESAHRLTERLAPWEDAIANLKSDVMTWINDGAEFLIRRFEESPIGVGLAEWLRVSRGPTKVSDVDTLLDYTRLDRDLWPDAHGRPTRFRPTTPAERRSGPVP